MKSTKHIAVALIALTVTLSGSISPVGNVALARQRTANGSSRKQLKGTIDRDVAMADELLLKGKYADAADLYRQAISRNSKNVTAIVGLGNALGKQFKLDGAEEQFDKALQVDPQNALALSGKAMVLLNRLQSSSTTYTKNRDSALKEAYADCQRALQIDPNMPEAHYNLGMVYKEQGNYDQAAAEFNSAVKSDPHYSEAYSGLGLSKLAMGDTGGAISAFNQAVTINSGNSTAHYGLGKAYLQSGQIDNAIKELNTSLYQFPNSAPARLAMGEAYEAQGNTVAAEKEYQQSIGIKPENPEAYLHIADIKEARGDLEHSIAQLRSGLELMPNNLAIHERIADESLRLEKLDDAIGEYKNVLNTNPQDPQAAKGLVRAYYLKAQKQSTGAFIISNDYESAEKYIDQAVAMNPNDMELRLAKAKLDSMSGKNIDLRSIGTPNNDGERIAYAEALLAQNKFADAHNQMAQVIANAQDTKQTFAVGDLALLIHDLDDAQAAYQKAATMSGGAERAKRGMDLVAAARKNANQDLIYADDCAKKKQLASAIEHYHLSIAGNPVVTQSRWGLAETLQRLSPHEAADLREAAVQYLAYEGLSPQLPPKEKEKIDKKIARLNDRAFKLEAKAKKQ